MALQRQRWPASDSQVLMKDSETLTKGDMLNLESGEVDLMVTSDVAAVGVFMGPDDPDDATDGQPGVVAGTDSTTLVQVIANPDAVYADPNDTNARLAGALLDISGATGAQTLASASNNEFVVVERKTTIVRRDESPIHGSHSLSFQGSIGEG
jgi:hypothetical protein